MTKKKSPVYEIRSLLDFTKVPQSKLLSCLNEFADWVKLMRENNKIENSPLTPIECFTWIDDSKRNINITIKIDKSLDKKS